jgi:predicted amidohydrolase
MAVDDLDVESNLETVASRLSTLPERVDLACFPEQALTGFVADDRITEAAITRDGEAIDRLVEAVSDAECEVLVGFVEAADGDAYNAAAYLDGDGVVAVYRKQHLWGGEQELLTPGDSRVTVETPLGKTGLLTCYDLNFVDESAAMTDKRVDALLVPGAWPATHSDNWRLLLRARALDGVRWVLGAGRTGRRDIEDAPVTDYAGRSLCVRPDGGIRAELDRAERTLVVDLDETALDRHRETVGIFE